MGLPPIPYAHLKEASFPLFRGQAEGLLCSYNGDWSEGLGRLTLCP